MGQYTDLRDAFFEELYTLAVQHKEVVLLVGDQGAKTLEKFEKNIPDQMVNAGIMEQNLVSAAAGLALGGKKVFVYAIASFLTLRCYEQIWVDVSMMKLPVTLIGMGGGFAYSHDGPTHHSTHDIIIMNAVPDMTILQASDAVSLAKFPKLIYENAGPTYVRLDKGSFPDHYEKIKHDLHDGICEIREGQDLFIISTGVMLNRALDIAQKLEEKNIKTGVIDLYRIKPLNRELLFRIVKNAKSIITLEEHAAYGGIGSMMSDFVCDHQMSAKLIRFGIGNKHYFDYGDRDYMEKQAGLDFDTIVKNIYHKLNV